MHRLNEVLARLYALLGDEVLRPMPRALESTQEFLARVRELEEARGVRAAEATETLVEVRQSYIAAVEANADGHTQAVLRQALAAASLQVALTHALLDLTTTDRTMAEKQPPADAEVPISLLDQVLREAAEKAMPPDAEPLMEEVITGALEACMRTAHEKAIGDVRAEDVLSSYADTVTRMANAVATARISPPSNSECQTPLVGRGE